MLHLLQIWVKNWHFRGIERAGLGLAGNVKMVGKGKKGDQSRGGGEMGIEVNRGHCAPVALLCSAAALRYQPSAPNSQVSTKPQTSGMQLAEELWLRFPDIKTVR